MAPEKETVPLKKIKLQEENISVHIDWDDYTSIVGHKVWNVLHVVYGHCPSTVIKYGKSVHYSTFEIALNTFNCYPIVLFVRT